MVSIDTRHPSVVSKFHYTSTIMVPAVTIAPPSESKKLSTRAKPGSTKAPTVTDPVPATGIADDKVPPLPEWEQYISFSLGFDCSGEDADTSNNYGNFGWKYY